MEPDQFWRARLPCSRKGTRWDRVLLLLVVYRLLSPGSEWRLHRQWFERSALPDLLGADESLADIHMPYACHDKLLAHKRAVFDHLVGRWRITRFIYYASELIGESRLLKPMRQALQTLRTYAERVVRRWPSTYTNARLDGLYGLFQAARARARGYRNVETFITMIGSPAGAVLKST